MNQAKRHLLLLLLLPRPEHKDTQTRHAQLSLGLQNQPFLSGEREDVGSCFCGVRVVQYVYNSLGLETEEEGGGREARCLHRLLVFGGGGGSVVWRSSWLGFSFRRA